MFIIYFEYSFIRERYNEYNKFLVILREKETKKEEYYIKNRKYEKIINRLNRDELDLKNERRKVANDISFYNYQLSLSNNYSKVREDNDSKVYKKD